MKRMELGIAVVGSGRIGTLRASMAAVHPAVSFLAVSDLDPTRALTLANQVGAQLSSGDNLEVISRPEVNAVIVSTSEPEHTLPVIQALERGKPVLVEKPIALTTEDADRMIAAAKKFGAELHVGYSQRFQKQYLLAKEQILQGRLGRIVGGTGRVYIPRSGTLEILQRASHATPVQDLLTYYVDMFCWFLEGNPPVEVVARGQAGVLKAAGSASNDVTWAILSFGDGTVVSLGVCSTLPAKYPHLGLNSRIEILGTEGVMMLDVDDRNQILYTDRGFAHWYIPKQKMDMVYLGTTAPGDWALGDFWGPLGSETRAWLDHLSTGRPCAIATAEQARKTLEVTLSIERAAQTRETITFPLSNKGND
jgi:predicted dehydrogenase